MLIPMLSDLAPMIRLQSEASRLFEGFLDPKPARGYSGAFPGVNMWEDGDCAYIEAELPGMGMDDIEVLVIGRDLEIKGVRKPATHADVSHYRQERAMGPFSRTLTLPWEIAADNVEAKLVDGVLTIKLPKSEGAKPKRVKLLTA